jgi:hypothetical protein
MKGHSIVVWFSRHQMSTEQKESLENRLGSMFMDFEYISLNETFPAKSSEAISRICEVVRGLREANPSTEVMCAGVFPAHIAAALARATLFGISSTLAEAEAWNNGGSYPLSVDFRTYFPVSVPAPAVEGELRGSGFIHSHWELA